MADEHDWGEEKDIRKVTKRLNDIQELRNLERRISDLEVTFKRSIRI